MTTPEVPHNIYTGPDNLEPEAHRLQAFDYPTLVTRGCWAVLGLMN